MAAKEITVKCVLISKQHEAVQIKSNLPQYQGFILKEQNISESIFLAVGFLSEAMANVWLNSVT